MCHHCTARRDDADHTLAWCLAWREERRSMKEVMGNNLTIQAIVGKIVEGEQAWRSFADYCGSVMRRKEEAERIRQGQQPIPNREQRGSGTSQENRNVDISGVSLSTQMSRSQRTTADGSNG